MYKYKVFAVLVLVIILSVFGLLVEAEEPEYKIYMPFINRISNIDVYCLWSGPGITNPFPTCPTIRYQTVFGNIHETEGGPYLIYKPLPPKDQPVKFDSVKLLRYPTWDNMYNQDVTINPQFNLKSWKELDSWPPDKEHTIFLCPEDSWLPTLIVGEFDGGVMFPENVNSAVPYRFGVRGIDCPE